MYVYNFVTCRRPKLSTQKSVCDVGSNDRGWDRPTLLIYDNQGSQNFYLVWATIWICLFVNTHVGLPMKTTESETPKWLRVYRERKTELLLPSRLWDLRNFVRFPNTPFWLFSGTRQTSDRPTNFDAKWLNRRGFAYRCTFGSKIATFWNPWPPDP